MLKRIADDAATEAGPPVRFTFDGRPLAGRAGDTLAAALLANGVLRFRRSQVSGAPRGPFCLMGACFECLVEVNGRANRQACMEPLAEGMAVRSQDSAAALVEAGVAAGIEPGERRS